MHLVPWAYGLMGKYIPIWNPLVVLQFSSKTLCFKLFGVWITNGIFIGFLHAVIFKAETRRLTAFKQDLFDQSYVLLSTTYINYKPTAVWPDLCASSTHIHQPTNPSSLIRTEKWYHIFIWTDSFSFFFYYLGIKNWQKPTSYLLSIMRKIQLKELPSVITRSKLSRKFTVVSEQWP